jgi:hypothetical protein
VTRQQTLRELISEVRNELRELRHELRAEFAEIRKRVDVLERPRIARVINDPSRPAGAGNGA